MPLDTTAIAPAEVSPQETWEAIARREWSSMSGKITHLRPPVRTDSAPSSCQQAFGADYTNRRYEALGFFFGSTRATPASRKIRANDETAGTGSIRNERVLS